MKRIIFAICTILCANVLMAQEQLATLKHNDSISVYYGASAFEQAYNAAANGDIITLSDGTFSTPSYVEKEITVRGNGACADTARKKIGTYFMERFMLRNLGDSLQFSAEGIYFKDFSVNNSLGIKLEKCFFESIGNVKNAQIINCIILSGSVDPDVESSNTFVNCIVKDISYVNSTVGPVHYLPTYSNCINCILIGKERTSSDYGLHNNCIIINPNGGQTLHRVSLNSILIGFTGASSPASSGNVVMSLSDVFENWDGETLSTDLETYVLKSSVSNSILGLDGSEVGIFGGVIPFDWTPTYSVIKRLDVPNTPDENGMLNIDVEFLTE